MAAAQERFVDTRQVGEALVSVISDGEFVDFPLGEELPEAARGSLTDANARGEASMGMNVVFLRTPEAAILVDPGWGPPSTKPAPDRGITRSPGVAAGLATLGVRPEAVTHVLITHAHWDHFTGGTVEHDGQLAPRYPNARYLLGRADWEGSPAREQPGSVHALHLGALERAGVLDLVDGDHEVVPGVTMLHTPGESPGHSIVRLRSGGERFYYLGDLFHHPCELERLDWVFKRRDVPATIASRQRFLAEAVPSGALLVCTHRPFPGWFRIVADGDGYRWQEPASVKR